MGFVDDKFNQLKAQAVYNPLVSQRVNDKRAEEAIGVGMKTIRTPDGRIIEIPASAAVKTLPDGSISVDRGDGTMPALYSTAAAADARVASEAERKDPFLRTDLDPFRKQIESEFTATSREAPTVAETDAYGGATIDRSGIDAVPINIQQENYQAGLRRSRAAQGAEAMAGLAQAEGLGFARQAAMGEAPSVAQEQMRSGIEAAARNQMATAASARGGVGAQMLARRMAADQGADIQQRAIGESAALRAGEMATARSAYLGGAEAARGQSLTGQQIGLGEAGLGLQERGQNIGLGVDLRAQESALATEQARLQQTAGLTAAEQALARATTNAGLQSTTQQQQDALRLGLLSNITAQQGQSRTGSMGYEQMLAGQKADADAARQREKELDEARKQANINAGIAAAGTGLGFIGNLLG